MSIHEFIPPKGGDRFISFTEFLSILQSLSPKRLNVTLSEAQAVLQSFGVPVVESSNTLTRAQAAVLLDQFLHPFERIDVDLYGNFIGR